MKNKGKLYLIPTPLGDNDPKEILPERVLEKACSLKVFVVEQTRTARRFLSKFGLKGQIDSLEFHELNEHTTPLQTRALLSLFDNGQDVGLLSEAGLPAVADPGAALVSLCHENGITVVPLTGPSSLMLALMASGLNGQSFAFCGYVTAKSEDRQAELVKIEKRSASLHQSQIIIETPYRNDTLFADMLKVFSPSTLVCIAADVTLPTETILTKSVSEWRSAPPFLIGKRPCVFVLMAQGGLKK